MRKLVPLALFCALCFELSGQDTKAIIQTYQRNFARSSLGTKLELLQEAASYEGIDMGPLYDTAIQFVLDNSSLLGSDVIMRDITLFSAQMLAKYRYVESADKIWNLFLAFKESTVRVPLLGVLGELGKNAPGIVDKLNNFLASQNMVLKAGTMPDQSVVQACIDALGSIGEGSSFPVLFGTMIAGYSDMTSRRAESALALIRGEYKTYLIEVIAKNPPQDKLAALKVGLNNPRITADDRGLLCEAALEAGLGFSGPDQNEIANARELRFMAAIELTNLKWSKASPLAVKHFYQTQSEYLRAIATKQRYLESIACLGAMGTSEAAQVLSIQLGLINSQTEQNKTYDDQISLAIINNLGILGDKAAFDYLLYVGYLNYPESVKKAAKDALGKLKW